MTKTKVSWSFNKNVEFAVSLLKKGYSEREIRTLASHLPESYLNEVIDKARKVFYNGK